MHESLINLSYSLADLSSIRSYVLNLPNTLFNALSAHFCSHCMKQAELARVLKCH